MHKFYIVFFLFILYTSANAQHKEQKVYCPEVFEMHKANGEQDLHYASSYRLDRRDTAIKTLLIYIHGLHRNGMNYFDYAQDAVRSAKEKKTTLVITPQYMNEEDIAEGSNLYWEKAGWKDGNESISYRNRNQKVSMSSYEALDSLITAVVSSGKFPNITRIVIAGHSAGGQFVQRYSAITPLPDLLSNYTFRFLVMNPSSYLYPDAQRPLNDSTYGLPDINACPQYNRYPKGLTDLNTYAQATGADRILHNMMHRDIVILLGNNDTRMDDPDLDVSCAGNLQGRFRLERGMFFIAHIKSSPGYGHKMNFSIVPGMAHEGDMINTPEALYWIYREDHQN
jgi:hypothetical protein